MVSIPSKLSDLGARCRWSSLVTAAVRRGLAAAAGGWSWFSSRPEDGTVRRRFAGAAGGGNIIALVLNLALVKASKSLIPFPIKNPVFPPLTMGRKSSSAAAADPAAALFSSDNPFRRRSPPPPAATPAAPAPPAKPKKRHLIDANPNPSAAADDGDIPQKKRERRAENANPNPNPNPSPEGKPKKRKRDELEELYERKRYGESVPVPTSAVAGTKRKTVEASAAPAAPAPPAKPKKRHLIDANPNPSAAADGADDGDIPQKKRERRAENANPNPNPSPEAKPKKRHLIDANPNPSAAAGADSDGDTPQKKRERRAENAIPNPNPSPEGKPKKRKRDELEELYERKRYGESVPVPTAAVAGTKRKAVEASAARDSFDDESKLLRTVFVGNLPLKMKGKGLTKEFARFGEIESVRIRLVPVVDSKMPRKGAVITGKINDVCDSMHAYVVFKDEQSASSALSHNMAEVGGKHIRVDMACPPRKKMKGEVPLYDRKRTLFVGNLPFDVKDEELYQLFCGSSPSESGVEAVRVIRDPHTSLGKGIAYVLFKSREAASSAFRSRDLMIRDRPLRICYAKQNATPSKPKEMQPRREFQQNSTVPSSSEPPSTKNDKPKSAHLSYQGLRASKTNVLKKSGILHQGLRASKTNVLKKSEKIWNATPSKPKEMRPKREFQQNRTVPSSSEPPSMKNDKPKSAHLSYQGLRASKTNVLKKSGIREKASFRSPSGSQGTKRAADTEPKVRQGKRPAVAARKAKLLSKRKQESKIPENTHQNKKFRKH